MGWGEGALPPPPNNFIGGGGPAPPPNNPMAFVDFVEFHLTGIEFRLGGIDSRAPK